MIARGCVYMGCEPPSVFTAWMSSSSVPCNCALAYTAKEPCQYVTEMPKVMLTSIQWHVIQEGYSEPHLRYLQKMTLMPFGFRNLSCYTPCIRTNNAQGIIFRRKERKNTQPMQQHDASHKREKEREECRNANNAWKGKGILNLNQIQEVSCPSCAGKLSEA